MKKIRALLCGLILSTIFVFVINTNGNIVIAQEKRDVYFTQDFFPDKNFRDYLQQDLKLNDDQIDGKQNINESIEKVTAININEYTEYGNAIESFEGLQYLKNLDYFALYSNSKVKELNFSEDTKLKNIIIFGTNIESIKFNDSAKLTTLEIRRSPLLAVFIAKEISEKKAYFSNLLSIEMSENKKTIDLDLTVCTLLERIKLEENNIGKINLSKSSKLYNAILDKNSLKEVNLPEESVLSYLKASDNDLKFIDLSNQINLVFLYLANNKLNSIDLSKNLSLLELNISSNNLKSIDIKNNKKLSDLIIINNQLSYLDVSQNESINYIDCQFNNIEEIRIPEKYNYSRFSAIHNKLKYYNIPANQLNGWQYGFRSIDFDDQQSESHSLFYDEKDEEWRVDLLAIFSNIQNLRKVKITDDNWDIKGNYAIYKKSEKPDGFAYTYQMDDLDSNDNYYVMNGYITLIEGSVNVTSQSSNIEPVKPTSKPDVKPQKIETKTANIKKTKTKLPKTGMVTDLILVSCIGVIITTMTLYIKSKYQ